MTKRTFTPFLVLGLALLLAACTTQPTPTPVPKSDLSLYLLVEATGDLSHKRPDWQEYLPLSFGTALDREDLLRAGPDAHGLIVCPDLTLIEVTGEHWGGLPHPQATAAPRDGFLPPRVAPVLIRGESLVVGPRRDATLSTSIPYVLSPRHTFSQTPHPLLRWHPSITGTATYTIRVWGGTLEWWAETTATELRYPNDAPPLELGVPYRLAVMDDQGHSSDQERTALDLSFALLPPEKVTTVQSLMAQAQGLGLDERATRLLDAEIYAVHGLRADGIALLEELATEEDAPTVHRRLGDLYLEVGLYTEARQSYERALAGYYTLGQKDGEAHVLAGLGLAYRGNRDDATARDYLEQALRLYQAIGDTDGVTCVKSVLDEMGR